MLIMLIGGTVFTLQKEGCDDDPLQLHVCIEVRDSALMRYDDLEAVLNNKEDIKETQLPPSSMDTSTT